MENICLELARNILQLIWYEVRMVDLQSSWNGGLLRVVPHGLSKLMRGHFGNIYHLRIVFLAVVLLKKPMGLMVWSQRRQKVHMFTRVFSLWIYIFEYVWIIHGQKTSKNDWRHDWPPFFHWLSLPPFWLAPAPPVLRGRHTDEVHLSATRWFSRGHGGPTFAILHSDEIHFSGKS